MCFCFALINANFRFFDCWTVPPTARNNIFFSYTPGIQINSLHTFLNNLAYIFFKVAFSINSTFISVVIIGYFSMLQRRTQSISLLEDQVSAVHRNTLRIITASRLVFTDFFLSGMLSAPRRQSSTNSEPLEAMHARAGLTQAIGSTSPTKYFNIAPLCKYFSPNLIYSGRLLM